MPRSRSRKKKSHKRRRILIVLSVLLLLGLAGGAYYVFKVAKKRTSPFKQARALHQAGDEKGAEEQLREVLVADAGNDRSRGLLIEILSKSDRIDEAEEFARYWLDEPETEALGLSQLARFALWRGDIVNAMRYARRVADRNPAMSQTILLQVQDALGSPVNRMRSARAAEALASLGTRPIVQAEGWLFAAEALRDLALMVPDDGFRESLEKRFALDREKARDALRESEHWKQRVPVAKAAMARIDLLGEDAEKREKALGTLDEHLEKTPDAHQIRMALVRYLISRSDYGKAAAHIRIFRDAPGLFFLRSISALADAGERSLVLELTEGVDASKQRMVPLVRARVLIAGTAAQRREGIQAFESLVLENEGDRMLLREAYARIRDAGDLERALRLLDKAGVDEAETRFGALLERTAQAMKDGNSKEADALLAELALEADTTNLSLAFQRLEQIEGMGRDVSLRLMDKVLEAGKSDSNALRNVRATLRFLRGRDEPDNPAWNQGVLGDITAVADDPKAARPQLFTAAALAIAISAPELAGRLTGRALIDEGAGGGDPVGLLLRALATKDDPIRKAAAAGMRQVEAGDYAPWLKKVADAVDAGDADLLRIPSAAWAPSKEAPAFMDATAQFRLAVQAREWGEAEAYAKLMMTTWAEDERGPLRLGAVYMDAQKFDNVLALHKGEDVEPAARLQRIEALRRLGRRSDAIVEARRLVRDTEGSDRAMLALAQLLKAKEPDAAFAVVSHIFLESNPNMRVALDLLRAELLEVRGDSDSAGQIYEELMRITKMGSLEVWRGLARVRVAQDRDSDFIRQVTEVVAEKPETLNENQLAELVLLRAQTREKMGDHERALEDYQEVLKTLPNNLTALNNAAWTILEHIVWSSAERPKRLQEALALVTRALEIAPVAPIYHTRAKIQESLERPKDALADYDKAIEILTKLVDATPEEDKDLEAVQNVRLRRARYQLDKADYLVEIKRDSDGRALYKAVRDAHPRTSEGRRAVRALGMDGK